MPDYRAWGFKSPLAHDVFSPQIPVREYPGGVGRYIATEEAPLARSLLMCRE